MSARARRNAARLLRQRASGEAAARPQAGGVERSPARACDREELRVCERRDADAGLLDRRRAGAARGGCAVSRAKILRIGIASRAAMKARTLAVARGKRKLGPDEPKVWFTSME